MANATSRVAKAHRSVKDENTQHSWGTLSAALQLYANAMVGLNAGYLAKFDDTASMRFYGIILEDRGNPKLPNDGAVSATQGALNLALDVKQPAAFELAISGVAITDIGRRVYALDDQTGTLDPSATTYANLIGTVKDLVFAADGGTTISGIALVKSIYDVPVGNQLQVPIVAGAIQLKSSTVLIKGSGVIALTLALPTTGVHDGMTIRIQSTTASAHTVTTPAVGFNATNTLATFGGAKGDGFEVTAAGVTWLVNWTRNVTLSA